MQLKVSGAKQATSLRNTCFSKYTWSVRSCGTLVFQSVCMAFHSVRHTTLRSRSPYPLAAQRRLAELKAITPICTCNLPPTKVTQRSQSMREKRTKADSEKCFASCHRTFQQCECNTVVNAVLKLLKTNLTQAHKK